MCIRDSSPGLSSLERQLCRWFCQRLGLPENAGGVLATGGTLSNLMALVTARSLQAPVMASSSAVGMPMFPFRRRHG